MYGNFTGIDFGGKSIRFCTIRKGFRDQKVETFYRVDIDETGNAAEVISSETSDKAALLGDVCTNFPYRPVSTRVIKFPFSDPKKIEQVYRFELENVSTFDPEEKLHSYHLVKYEKGSDVLVSMYEKEHMKEFLETFENSETEPGCVTFTPVAFSSLDHYLPSKRPLLLVDVGENEISFSLFDERGLKRVRSSTYPGEEILNLIDSDTVEINEGIGQKLDGFLNELTKTSHFFESELKRRIELFVLNGELCRITGVEKFLEEKLHRSVQNIYIDELGRKASPEFSRAFALALYGSGGGEHPMNLRTGEFEYANRKNMLREVFLVPAVLATILLALMFYKTASDYYTLKSQAETLRQEIQAEVKKTFPNAGNVAQPVAFMESEVNKVRSKLRVIENIKGGASPLEVLRDLSISVPENIDLKLDEIRFETNNRIRVWARCDSYMEIATIEEALSRSGNFSSVSREQVSRAPNNTIKFVLALEMK